MTESMIVTGAGSGIGEAIARHASDAGYRVGVLDIAGDAAHRVADSIENAVALVAAVDDPVHVEAALDQFGTPTALVNNAGIVRFGALLEQSLSDWQAVVDVNLTGMYVCSTACARRMADVGGGAIVSLTSINGIAPGTNSGAYGPTKAAIDLLSKQMSIEWGPIGIRVNTVAPGLIDGGMSAPIFVEPEFRRRRTEKVPAGRLGTVDDVARAVIYLCSSDADYVTGQQLAVDGGVINSIIANLPRPATLYGEDR